MPPYDHPDVIAGQGTAALELAEDAEAAGLTLDALLVCTGGGGLIGGCALAMSGASPGTKVIAVEPQGWDDTGRSLAEGHRVANAPGGSMLCDALLAPTPGELTFAVNQAHLAGAVAVSDAEVLAAMAFAFTHLKLVVEPGGAVALAALLSGRYARRARWSASSSAAATSTRRCSAAPWPPDMASPPRSTAPSASCWAAPASRTKAHGLARCPADGLRHD